MFDAALVACIFCAALLRSSVGHAAASRYLASMSLFGVAPEKMRPAALVLNIIVAAISTDRFAIVRCFSWRTEVSPQLLERAPALPRVERMQPL
jgi:hypothetical protein